MDYASTKRVLAALEREQVAYTVFGGVALNLHGLARATEDLDVFVDPTPGNIERLRRALFSVFEDPDIEGINTEDLLGEYPAVQYIPPQGGFHIDILTRLGEMFRFDQLDSERIPLEDLEVNVVTPRMLYEMKKDTVRPLDKGDASRLIEKFGFED